jgi:hypothetical protein
MPAQPNDQPIRAAVFRTVSQADDAVDRLLKAGFTAGQITVVCSDETKERHFREFEHQDPAGSHAPAAAATGGVIGAALGGFVAMAGAAATGGAAAVAAGAFLAAAGGSVAGGLIGAMTTRGMEKEVADYYDQAVAAGRILVAVEDEGENRAETLAQAEQIFAAAGAEPISLEEG